MSRKSDDEGFGRAPRSRDGEWLASGSLLGGGGGGKGGLEDDEKARGTRASGFLRGLMWRSAMAAAGGRGGGSVLSLLHRVFFF
jgi:hypothetical protein